MAVTLAKVANPNQIETVIDYGPFKGVFKVVTLDNSYLTTGEVVTAAQVGFRVIVGVVDLQGGAGFSNAAGTQTLPALAKVSATGSQVAFQAQRYDGASAGKANLEEAAATTDLSLFSGKFLFIGY